MNFETDALSDTMMESERAQRRLRRNEVTERMIAQSHDFVSIGDETDVAGVGDDQLGVATVVNSGLTEAGERVSASNQDYVSHAHNLPDPPHTTDDPSRGDSSGRGRPVGTLATTVQGLSPITIKNGSYGSSADALARKEARAELAVARFPVFVGNHRYKDDQSPCTLPPVFGDVGYGQSTVFVGLTPDRHVCSDGSTRMALRYTYDIPWLSNKRLPRPLKEDWARLFKKDAMLVQKLKKEGHFDAYDNVFRKYEDQGAMVEIPIKSDDFAQIDAVIPHFPVYAPSAVSTKVRPVINGIYYRGIIGNGRGDEDPKANTLRSTIPSLTVFRCYEHVYLSDLKMAFYQLANAPAAKYVFCIVWNSRVFRLRGPGMGAPHAPSCLQDAVCRLGKLSVAKLPIPISKKLESEKFGRKCICWKPYMDDVVLGATSRSLLDVAHTAFTSACDRRGFPFQPAKERDRPPAEGCPGSTTSFSTTS
ncbi:hypothetical protein Pmar_PMAR006958 [Perkinsus marinus ATCC 50983]|uniref:Reverse transcriptase domain-containing protein n=1 Tax=Perkinsus marinus (strain ATCC 50983 / TXsc) TaxID=423536 RepID=C5KJW8_PERM5|nr:hypothetical protein Pmar_PMAR006958 [Perkinsus marinus ATCC 50983]EER15226.1 hypothetical protein Pmar_PMAR006958 [Perkinsus marinus ATCC 50983]|eukprot:XP_002783430.1 hypothetical protein Pmar_PMAR006958 [Perkinsus marinus ATCC 50983]